MPFSFFLFTSVVDHSFAFLFKTEICIFY